MSTTRSAKAEEYRLKARECAEIAGRMSIGQYRHQMEQLARKWFELADLLDNEGS